MLLCLVAACSSITTVYPVGISRGTQHDARLAGVWKVVEAKGKPIPPTVHDKAYLIFIPETSGEYSAIFSSWRVGKPNPDTFILDLVIGGISGQTLLNAKLLGEISKPGKVEATDKSSVQGYWQVLYRIGGDGRMRLYKMSDEDFDNIQRAVESRRLEGTVQKSLSTKNEDGRQVHDVQISITAAPRALDSYFEKEIRSTFSEPLYTFQKID